MTRPDFKRQAIYPFVLADEQGAILHEGEMNEKAWNKTIENKALWEWIRSNERVVEKSLPDILIDTDGAQVENGKILLKPLKEKAENKSLSKDVQVLIELEKVIRERKKEMPPNSYTTHLFEKGEEKILKKLGEEAVELILASAKNETEIINESSDLIYHLLVLLVYKNIPFEKILEELHRRHR